MGLAQANASVHHTGVVSLPRIFGDSIGGHIGKIVVVSANEALEVVLLF